MVFSKRLKEAEELTLREAHRYHPLSITRFRAHCILLSNQHYKVDQISEICDLDRKTVLNAIHAWNKIGLLGLIDKPRSGRPKRLTPEQEIVLLEQVKENPRSLKKVLSEFTKIYQVEITLDMLRRLCKSAKFTWKRVRKSLKSKRDQAEFENSKNLINQLIERYKKGEIKLGYYDESAFSLEPSVPYAWQEIGKYIEVPSSRSKSLSVLGCLSLDNEFESIVVDGSVTSDVVIHYFDEISKTCDINKPTIILLDNAPTHTSYKFDQKTIEWCTEGLVIVPIARYSPELNLIEILWRKIKYEWMPFCAYESIDLLEKSLFYILKNIGHEFRIQFS